MFTRVEIESSLNHIWYFIQQISNSLKKKFDKWNINIWSYTTITGNFKEMTESDYKNIDFYREQYLFEHERGKFYDKVIQYPTTLIIVFIGVAFYSFTNYFGQDGIKIYSCLDWIFTIVLGLFLIITIISIYFLSSVFHGFTRKYYYLPYSGELLKHEKQLYGHHYKYSDKESYKEKRIDAKTNTWNEFSNNLKKYYIELTETNQKINDKRADSYYLTRTFLFIDLIFLIVIGILGIL